MSSTNAPGTSGQPSSDDEFYPVRVPPGRVGAWSVSYRSLDQAEVENLNLQHRIDCADEGLGIRPELFYVAPGTYAVLEREDARGQAEVFMSNTPMEARTNRKFIDAAEGRVLVTGLGIGMVIDALLKKPEVQQIDIVEKFQDVVDLVGPLYKDEPRVKIICADALTWRPEKGVVYDYVWHDIWPTIGAENYPEMVAMRHAYKPYASWQGCWAEDICRRQYRHGGGPFVTTAADLVSKIGDLDSGVVKASDGMKI